MKSYNEIPPKILHKSSSDDVLLMNPRRAIPIKIESSKNKLNYGDNKCLLECLYEKQGGDIYSFYNGLNSDFLNNHVLKMKSEGINFGVPYQILDSIINSNDCENKVDVDDEVSKFSKLLSNNNNSTSFQFINNAEHYFFYRKQHEHVPGIMFMEAARQAIYYQLYNNTHHKLGEVTVSLTEMKANYYTYAELMYPIEVIVDDLENSGSLLPNEVFYGISFYQRGNLIAYIKIKAPVIPMHKFTLARNAYLMGDSNFLPLEHSPLVALITDHDLNQSIVSLKSINISGCVTSNVKNHRTEKAILTLIYDKSICFSTSIYKLKSEIGTTTWSFERVDYEELEKLKEMIKRGFIVCNN
ncbi:hypothetical protein M8G38_04995 [Providencia stuartii]|uniref:AfsA-related hotdog domain-containing protein n=1 Tax=Providencia stuartii TaxID=588 RepID=UPI00201DC645|nr:AfsA-related hotdog domain-containing protein [Providencia stuartii]UQZ12937.1 hypothetical protein M8G38_04995 [Providencia stuartii]